MTAPLTELTQASDAMTSFWNPNLSYAQIAPALVPHVYAIRAALAQRGVTIDSLSSDERGAGYLYHYAANDVPANVAGLLREILTARSLDWTLAPTRGIPVAAPAMDVVNMDEKVDMPEFLVLARQNGATNVVKTSAPIETLRQGTTALKGAIKLPSNKNAKCGLYMRMTSAQAEENEVQLDSRAEVVGLDNSDEEEEDAAKPEIVAKSSSTGGKAAKAKTVVIDGVEIQLVSHETLPSFQIVRRDARGLSVVSPKDESLDSHDEAVDLLELLAQHAPDSDFSIYHLTTENRAKDSKVKVKSHATLAAKSPKTGKAKAAK